MGLRDRLKNALVALLEEPTPTQPPMPSTIQTAPPRPSLTEADVRRMVAEFASKGVTTAAAMDSATEETATTATESNVEGATESNFAIEIESSTELTTESNFATPAESNIIDPVVAKRRRGMLARIRRLRDTAKWPPAGRRYYEIVKTFNDDGDEIEVRRDLEFVEESMASLCDMKTHPLKDTKWERERPAQFPEHYGVIDGAVVETPYIQRPNHLPTDHGWLSVLRQDLPVEMQDRHDYYASFGLRCWLVPDGERYAVVYWSPDPANWADANDRAVVAWPQTEATTIGTVSLNDVASHMSEADGAPAVRQFAYRVGHVDQPFAGARATWGRQMSPRPTITNVPKRMEFVFNVDSERLTLDEVRH